MRKREADDDLSPVPSLGEVAEEADFAPLHELLETIKGRPVDKLGLELRAALKKRGGDEQDLLLSSFFDECDARAKAASLKRANVGSDESVQGEHQCFSLFFLSSPLSHPFLFSRAP